MAFGYCKDCDCFRTIKTISRHLKPDSAFCCRHAPTLIQGSQAVSQSIMYYPVFPLVKEYYGCGENIPKGKENGNN